MLPEVVLMFGWWFGSERAWRFVLFFANQTIWADGFDKRFLIHLKAFSGFDMMHTFID